MNLDFNDFQNEVRRKNIAIEKSFAPFYIDPEQRIDIEKGRRAGVGEIRTHGGRKVQKQGDGSWKSVKEEIPSDMKTAFLSKRPEAKVTEKKNSKGDTIVYVNGQTAFNKEDRHNSSNWLTMMENAYKRGKNVVNEGSRTLKFKDTLKGEKARAIALEMGNASETAIIEELRLRGYSDHFTSEIHA